MKINFTNACVLAVVLTPFAFIALVSCAPETQVGAQTAHISAPLSDDVTAVCIGGVQYWQNSRGNYAPKYSPGFHNQDTCK